MIRIVPIKFRDAGKQYDFNALQLDLRPGQRVVVETDRGRALGTVVTVPHDVSSTEVPADCKSVLRSANEEDLAMATANVAREKEAFRYCQLRILERHMDMKLVRAEYLFDGSKIVFFFTADGRVDFRELVKDLAHHFHTRIEMRQIGVRDEAKLTGGIGICGRELCCCTFLTEFAPVSVKMAKEQGLALNPTKISGQCGRLLCCLAYEFETYCNLRKGLPKAGRKVVVDGVEGDVIDVNVLAQKVTVRLADGRRLDIKAEEVAAGERLQPLVLGQPPTPSGGEPISARVRRERPPRRPLEQRSSGSRPTETQTQPPPQPPPQPQPEPRVSMQPAPADIPEGEPGEETKTARKGRRRNRNRRRTPPKG